MPHNVRYGQNARADLQTIIDWIATEAGADVAHRYVDGLRAHCEGLADFPRRGRLRRRAPDIRSLSYRRSITIIYRIRRGEVLILRVLHNSGDIESQIADLR